METQILNTGVLPYCKGCGHDLIARNMALALERSGLSALDVIMVTDIGCHGIIDRCLNTHTVHGLHGRSVALGAGISFGLGDSGKKIIVLIGDGGSTIGLQHILEAARLNLNMTVLVHNNMLYGMTGGQTSGLTPCGFRTSTSSEGNPYMGYDVCALTHSAGASFVSRIAGIGDISGQLEEAFGTKGFSLVEVMEICPGYGVKFNPRRKLSEIIEQSGRLTGKWTNKRDEFLLVQGDKTDDLLDDISYIEPEFECSPGEPVKVLISGSAGEGVQLTAAILSSAAVSSSCHVTQKGIYPVTVGVGFSTAELVISPHHVHYHGFEVPDVVLVTSEDGLAHCKKKIESMKDGKLFIDSSLEVPVSGATIYSYDFRSAGARSASLYALFRFAADTGYVSIGALMRAIEESGYGEKLQTEKILTLIRS